MLYQFHQTEQINTICQMSTVSSTCDRAGRIFLQIINIDSRFKD